MTSVPYIDDCINYDIMLLLLSSGVFLLVVKKFDKILIKFFFDIKYDGFLL